MDKIDDIRKKHRKLMDEANKLARQINDAELSSVLPSLQKKYVGKWFKRTDKDTYYDTTTYSKVLEVNGQNSCNTFRVMVGHGKKGKGVVFVHLQSKDYDYLSLLGKLSSYEQAKFDYEKAQDEIVGKHFKAG